MTITIYTVTISTNVETSPKMTLKTKAYSTNIF